MKCRFDMLCFREWVGLGSVVKKLDYQKER